MDNKNLSLKLTEYAIYLQSEERSKNTVTKYVRDLLAFLTFEGGGEITKTTVPDWKGLACGRMNFAERRCLWEWCKHRNGKKSV